MSSRSSPTRRHKALIVGVACLVGLLLAEGIVRLYADEIAGRVAIPRGAFVDDWAAIHIAAHNPRIGYEMAPSLDVVVRGTPLQTNTHGLRGPEVERHREARTLRIAGVGDSVMVGWGVDQDATYLARLPQQLEASGSRFVVKTINFGVSGYNTVQEYYVLRDKVLAYAPDIVVLGFTGNDFESGAFTVGRPWLKTPLWSLNYFALALQRHVAPNSLASEVIYDWRTYAEPETIHPNDVWSGLRRFSELCHAHRIPVVVLLDSRYQSEIASHDEVAAFCRELGLHTLNLYPIVRGPALAELAERRFSHVPQPDAHERLFQLLDDGHPNGGHPNEIWHALAAELLGDRLLQDGLLGDPVPVPDPQERLARAVAHADWSSAHGVTYAVDGSRLTSGLWLVAPRDDGLHYARTIALRRARMGIFRGGNSIGYLYFQIQDTFHVAERGSFVITVDYFDESGAPIFLDYDAYEPGKSPEAARYTRVQVAERHNSGSWKQASVQIDDAWFGNGQNQHADFRLGSLYWPVAISGVHVERVSTPRSQSPGPR